MNHRFDTTHRGIRFGLMTTLLVASSVLAEGNFSLEEFSEPPAWYHSAPLWVWNDDITEEEIEHQLEMLRSQQVLQAFVHPRPGLITPYLSDRWLDRYEFAVKTAKAKGMLLHIYDENSYPSGFAGGHVYRHHPEWAGKGFVLVPAERLPEQLSKDVLAVYRREGETISRVEDPPLGKDGDFILAQVVHAGTRAWTGDGPYVDLLAPGLTEEFLRITYEPYRQRFGDEFGTTVRGAFTDEPHLVPAGKLHWTPRLPQLFRDRYGYDLLDAIPSLFEDVGDYRKVRFDFYQLLLDEFIERWSKPYHDYCEKHNLMFTGHYWEHEWPRVTRAQDNMAMYAFHQMPAIDCLMNRYSEDPHAQFGNVRAVVELSSIANQLGMRRRLCEVYGAGGWEMSFEDQKRIADWLAVLGVNFFNQHLTYMTLRGARKRDHPLSFSDHEPWWEHYHILGKYLARLAYSLSRGEEMKRILLMEPTTTAWLLDRPTGSKEEVEALGTEFQGFLTNLSLDQVEYDLGCERTIRDHGRIEDGKFVVGNRRYDLLILHRTCRNLTRSTFDLIREFKKQGGAILLVGGAPEWVNGRPEPSLAEEFPRDLKPGSCLLIQGEQEVESLGEPQLAQFLNDRFSSVLFPSHEGGKLFHQFRETGSGGLLFLANTSSDETVRGTWKTEGKGVEILDLFTGTREPAVFVPDSETGTVSVEFELPPAGSLLYRISGEPLEPATKNGTNAVSVPIELVRIERLKPNILPIDYVDYRVRNTQEEGTFFFIAQTKIYHAHGLSKNPWDRAVQFKDTILRKDSSFGPSTGFVVEYPFTIDGFSAPPGLALIVEQPERYTIDFNGQEPSSPPADTNDPHFKVLQFETGSKVGENRLRMKATPFSVHHEVEPIYVTGDFSLRSTDHGWTIEPPRDLEYGSWKSQGMPFYSDAVRYTFRANAPAEGRPMRLRLVDWKGTVAAVHVNGEKSGVIAFPPNQIELPALKPGENEISVDVYGSLKNLYGPHHGNPGLGAAWPSGFLSAPRHGPPPGEEYDVIDYGLFGPPILEAIE